MNLKLIKPHTSDSNCARLKTDDGCYWCCTDCNYDTHTCPGCGAALTHLGNDIVDDIVGAKHGGCV